MNSISLRLAVLTTLVFGMTNFGFVPSAYAADQGGWGWADYGTYDTWSDYGTYDTWSDYGSYDTWSDYGTYGGYTDTYYYDTWSDYGTYGGYTDTYYYDQPYTDYYYPDQSYTDYYYYDQNYTDYYYPDYGYGGGYDWGCGSYCGTGGSGGGFDWGCGSMCGSYSTPSYSIPRYTTGGPSSGYSNVVTNTNTNVNNITNIDNSINDSFNNYNSGNTSIVVTNPQPPVYNPPVYNPPVVHPAPYCTITHAQYGGYGHGAYLSWTSTNASSAYISGIGSVSLSGSQSVYGGGTYTMTVYGYNGQTATCATTVQGTYVPPVYNQPYVSLTQIPYTGFDFGPIGNAMYWVALLGFAAAGAYLMVYYRGGALAFATAFAPARKYQPVVAPKAPILVEREAAMLSRDEVKVQPILASLKKNAVGTLDTMAIVQSKDGSMPRIVIQRA